jgi:hypothetical protein
MTSMIHRLLHALSFAAAALFISASLVAAPPDALSPEPWEDRAYGFRVRLPEGLAIKSQTGDEYLFRAADEKGVFLLSLAVKRSNSVLTLAQVTESARKQILSVQGTSEVLSERNVTLINRPGVIIHARMPMVVAGGEQLLSQAIVQLDAQTFAVLEGRTPFTERAKMEPLFDTVAQAMQMDDPKVVDQRRQEALTAGQDWRSRVGLKAMQDALVPEQLYRLVRGSDDVGYVRMRQGRGQREGFSGFEVEVQTRVVAENNHIDSVARFFLSDDERAEFWTITTTRRPAQSAPGQPAGGVTFSETGIRTENEILVTTDGPTGQRKNRLAKPPIGYLSQFEAMVLPQILPIDRPATYGFYFYSARAGKLTFRTDQVTPALTGFVITTRLSPNDLDIRSNYTAARVLVEKQLGNDEKQLPTTAAELARIWAGRQ